MIKEIENSNTTIRPFKVYKQWEGDQDTEFINVSQIHDGLIGSSDINIDRKIAHWKSIKKLYYTNQEVAGVNELGDRFNRISDTERILKESGSVITIPPETFGEELKRYSIRLIDSVNDIVLVDDGHSNLIGENDTPGEVPSKGNVFYQNGLIVLSNLDDPENEFQSFDLQFKSTVTIYEHEFVLNVLEGEFNISQNPTAIEFKDDIPFVKNQFTGSNLEYNGEVWTVNSGPTSGSVWKPGDFNDYFLSGSTDPTGSYLTPFVTTVGLYDDACNMLAVAKFAQPIKMLPDQPINFIVRLDL